MKTKEELNQLNEEYIKVFSSINFIKVIEVIFLKIHWS